MKNLIIFSHPHLATSQTHRSLLDEIADLPQVKIHHLESMYPTAQIDVQAEQQACEHAERIIWQFPLFWHSCPALLKAWQDDVLARNWAYGARQALAGKTLQLVVSTGSPCAAYVADSDYVLDAFWIPMQASAQVLGMKWGEPLVLRSVEHDPPAPFSVEHQVLITQFAQQYCALLGH
jgi:putative NADPH-quinone reductase